MCAAVRVHPKVSSCALHVHAPLGWCLDGVSPRAFGRACSVCVCAQRRRVRLGLHRHAAPRERASPQPTSPPPLAHQHTTPPTHPTTLPPRLTPPTHPTHRSNEREKPPCRPTRASSSLRRTARARCWARATTESSLCSSEPRRASLTLATST